MEVSVAGGTYQILKNEKRLLSSFLQFILGHFHYKINETKWHIEHIDRINLPPSPISMLSVNCIYLIAT